MAYKMGIIVFNFDKREKWRFSFFKVKKKIKKRFPPGAGLININVVLSLKGQCHKKSFQTETVGV